jgi:hypothetical protein
LSRLRRLLGRCEMVGAIAFEVKEALCLICKEWKDVASQRCRRVSNCWEVMDFENGPNSYLRSRPSKRG